MSSLCLLLTIPLTEVGAPPEEVGKRRREFSFSPLLSVLVIRYRRASQEYRVPSDDYRFQGFPFFSSWHIARWQKGNSNTLLNSPQSYSCFYCSCYSSTSECFERWVLVYQEGDIRWCIGDIREAGKDGQWGGGNIFKATFSISLENYLTSCLMDIGEAR